MKLETNLRALQFPEGTIDATVNGLEVEHKKPDPEIYLVAAQKRVCTLKNAWWLKMLSAALKQEKQPDAKCWPYAPVSRLNN